MDGDIVRGPDENRRWHPSIQQKQDHHVQPPSHVIIQTMTNFENPVATQPPVRLVSRSPEDTQRLGHIIGAVAQAGDIVLLNGPLGAGKTCLTQGIALGLGVSEGTSSPSFVLMREFAGRLPLYHMDLYRLEGAEINELGLDDYIFGQGLCVIEWAEKGSVLMPEEHLSISLDYAGNDQRIIEISASGNRYSTMMTKIASGRGAGNRDKD